VLSSLGSGPTLQLEAGNALFRGMGEQDAPAKARASFILEALTALGVKALAPGVRDLGAGTAFLKAEAARVGLPIVSANLRDSGKQPFPSSVVLNAGGLKVGVVGLSPVGPVGGVPGVEGLPIVGLARTELKALKGKADLLVVLAAVPHGDALELSQQLKGEADFVLQSGGDGRGFPPPEVLGAVVVNGGVRGQGLGLLELVINGGGPWVDLSEVKRDQELLKSLEERLKDVAGRRKAATDKAVKDQLATVEKDFTARRDELKKKALAVGKGGRTFDLTWKMLDKTVADEPELKAQVLVHEPSYKGQH